MILSPSLFISERFLNEIYRSCDDSGIMESNHEERKIWRDEQSDISGGDGCGALPVDAIEFSEQHNESVRVSRL